MTPARPGTIPPTSNRPGTELCLANARLVLRDQVITGRLIIEGDQIAEITETGDVPPGATDCAGDLLIPGLVELHTDNLERHIEPRPHVEWPHAAAIIAHDAELASTGITTVFDAMRVGSIPSGRGRYLQYARSLSRELLDLRAADALKISHFLHLRAETCSETLLDELAEFDPDDRVGVLSLMDHTPGQRQFRDMGKLKSYIMGKKSMTEAEFADHVERLTALRDKNGARHEAGAVAAARRLGAVLASHDDTTPDQVAVSAGHGIQLAEFPTTKAAARACRAAGIAIMMGAPNIMRGGSHSNNVSALDLAREGLLDIVSSDYIPAALLQSALRLAEIWQDLPRAIRCVTDAPARATGLQDRGVLAVGHRADMVRLRPVAGTHVVQSVWSGGQRVS